MGRTKKRPTRRIIPTNHIDPAAAPAAAEEEEFSHIRVRDHSDHHQHNQHPEQSQTLEREETASRTRITDGDVVGVGLPTSASYDSLVDSGPDDHDHDHDDDSVRHVSGPPKKRKRLMKKKDTTQKKSSNRRTQANHHRNHQNATNRKEVEGESDMVVEPTTPHNGTGMSSTDSTSHPNAYAASSEEKKEEADDDQPSSAKPEAAEPAPSATAPAPAEKPNPEIEFVKCRRKNCKTILKFLSPHAFHYVPAPISSCTKRTSACSDEADHADGDTASLLQQVPVQSKDTSMVIRSFVLYETCIESDVDSSSSGSSGSDIGSRMEISTSTSTSRSAPSGIYQIQTPTASLQVLNYQTNQEYRRLKKQSKNTSMETTESSRSTNTSTNNNNIKRTKISWDAIIPAIEHDLIRMELQPCSSNERSNETNACTNDTTGVRMDAILIKIRLTPKAFDQCSPYNLPRKVPLKPYSGFRSKASKKIDEKVLACMLQEALGLLFQGSILDDLLPVPKSILRTLGKDKRTRRGSKSVKDKEADEITAKMVYKAVDNAHSHLFEGGKRGSRVNVLERPGQSNGDRVEPSIRTDSTLASTSLIQPTNGDRNGLTQEISEDVPIASSPEEGGSGLTNNYLDTTSNQLFDVPGLVPKLRKYQEAAVRWMLQRERGGYEDRGWEISWIVILDAQCRKGGVINSSYHGRKVTGMGETGFDDIVIPLYRFRQSRGTIENRPCIFYNPFSGWLAKTYEIAKVSTIGNDEVVKGGILAESMGLGKTVEVLACILSNPKPNLGHTASVQNNCFQEKDSNKVDAPPLVTGREFQTNVDDFICFCGKGGRNKNTLSWVLCTECYEPMHGVCAGFIGEEDLLENSSLATGVQDNLPYRFCSAIRCPTCISAKHILGKEQIQSRATLIVTPPSILSQWEREIKRHTLVHNAQDESNPTRPLRVKVYHGVQKLCSISHMQAKEGFQRRLLNPHYLADADIVLTTFQVLMSDLTHSNDNPYISPEGASSRRISRTRKRYRVVPSPLMSIYWWRTCLDEAQRVETPTAASARMALKLASHHKWCVTGTPAGRGKMNDLYGLLLFLNSKPFCEKDWFFSAAKAEYRDVLQRIEHLFQETLWRSTKSNNVVRDQMGIPEQIEKKEFLDFSSIERHFYQRQLEETILAADAIIGEKNGNKRRKAKNEDMLSNQLHRLRAACCHPQVGVGGIGNLKRQQNYSGTSVATGVLSMSQILDRLIDDAKVKAEEAQRLYTLNTNAIATLYRLKSESGSRCGTLIDNEDEINLLQKSSKAYLDAIEIADKNSSPSPIVGEAVLTGCVGFQTPGAIARDGAASIAWVLQKNDEVPSNPEVWTRFDFNGAVKKITSLAVRPLKPGTEINNIDCLTLFPRDCVVQVSNAAIGGMFVDAIHFTLTKPSSLSSNEEHHEWQQFQGHRPHKSKSWRIYVKNYHDEERQASNVSRKTRVFVGVEIQLLEPDVLPDSLQRLHILHNGALTLTTLRTRAEEQNIQIDEFGGKISSDTLHDTIAKMKHEKESLESHYIEAARVLQVSSQDRLEEVTKKRKAMLAEFDKIRYNTGGIQETWWNDLVALCYLHPDRHFQNSLSECVEQSLFELFNDPSQPFNRRSFPVTDSLDGLHIALSMRLQDNTFFTALATNNTGHELFQCIHTITKLSDNPSENEIYENSHCHKCRSDWDQRGPKCKCCKLEEKLLDHQNKINEGEINCILRSMYDWIKRNVNTKIRSPSGSLKFKNLSKKAEKFFEAQECIRKELEAAKSKWRTHLDLLSDIDELNQCKQTMRLSYEGENLFGLTAHQQAFIVQPRDINGLLMDHTAKQAMAEGNLRRTKELLRFLKNQNLERKQSILSQTDDDKNTCCICLCPFGENDRAVLRCGHTYHFHCLEQIFARSGGGNHAITCPMRCAIRTKKEDILIASDISKDDGSKTHRAIQGSWGTKVDRLIADLLGVVATGEKSIVFSQWDDMLHILEIALQTNSVSYVRPKSMHKFGDSMNYFRTSKCHVLLLHVKHGAEGLTIVEANHVFMIEPLLNHSMDSQAINRIHRIGQTSKTFIHRYIIKDTIEVKIDRLRGARQIHEGEAEETHDKESTILRAGGLDGGFNENELQELLEYS